MENLVVVLEIKKKKKRNCFPLAKPETNSLMVVVENVRTAINRN